MGFSDSIDRLEEKTYERETYVEIRKYTRMGDIERKIAAAQQELGQVRADLNATRAQLRYVQNVCLYSLFQ